MEVKTELWDFITSRGLLLDHQGLTGLSCPVLSWGWFILGFIIFIDFTKSLKIIPLRGSQARWLIINDDRSIEYVSYHTQLLMQTNCEDKFVWGQLHNTGLNVYYPDLDF